MVASINLASRQNVPLAKIKRFIVPEPGIIKRYVITIVVCRHNIQFYIHISANFRVLQLNLQDFWRSIANVGGCMILTISIKNRNRNGIPLPVRANRKSIPFRILKHIAIDVPTK